MFPGIPSITWLSSYIGITSKLENLKNINLTILGAEAMLRERNIIESNAGENERQIKRLSVKHSITTVQSHLEELRSFIRQCGGERETPVYNQMETWIAAIKVN